jgi:hypothetical protein
MADLIEFIECTSLSISYDNSGVATVNFIVVRNKDGFPSDSYLNNISAGGQSFSGHVTNITVSPIQNTDWYESHVTLVTTTQGG